MSLHNRGTISIVGLYNWDDTIFDDMVLPASVDRAEIIQDILYTCADLELVYPDWGVMKNAIEVWSKEEIFKWDKIERLAELEYNPIENYDRYESEKTSDTRQKTGNDVNTNTGTGKAVNNSGTTNKNTTTHGVTGYNTTTPVTDRVDSVNGQDTQNSMSENNGRGSEVRHSLERETGDIIRTNRTHGNIGVTAPYQMILGDLSVYDSINLCKIIPVDFKLRFCLMVY